MLWMLGVVAIIVDVVSRYKGPGPSTAGIHLKKVQITTSKPHDIFNTTPTVDVTYIVINEKIPSQLSTNTIENIQHSPGNDLDMDSEDLQASFPASRVSDVDHSTEKPLSLQDLNHLDLQTEPTVDDDLAS